MVSAPQDPGSTMDEQLGSLNLSSKSPPSQNVICPPGPVLLSIDILELNSSTTTQHRQFQHAPVIQNQPRHFPYSILVENSWSPAPCLLSCMLWTQPGTPAKCNAKGKAAVATVASCRTALSEVPNGQAPTVAAALVLSKTSCGTPGPR